MSGVANVTIQPSVPKVVNFKAGENEVNPYRPQRQAPVITRPPMNDQVMLQRMIQEQQKKEKNQKLKQNLSWSVGIASGLAIIAMVLASFRSARKGAYDGIRSELEKMATVPQRVDVSKIKPRHEDCYAEEAKTFLKTLENSLKRGDTEAKNGKRIVCVEFLGPGGTGKTDSAARVAKKVEEIYPGSEYYVPDLSMLSSNSYMGQNTQLLTEYTENICARAQALKREGEAVGQKRFATVFLDEFDKIAMEDHSINKANSNRSIGALKTLINGLKDQDNVIIITATNYPELIEGAIDSRIAKQVLFDYLTPKQIITAITEHYKVKPDLISKELLDVNNPKLKKVCDIIGRKEHCTEYRKIFDNLIPTTLDKSPDGKPIELKHLVEALLDSDVSRRFNLSEVDRKELKSLIS